MLLTVPNTKRALLTRGWGREYGSQRRTCRCSPAPAGLFFGRRLRSHTHMDPDLETVIRQALGDAEATGRDHLSQTGLAVRAVEEIQRTDRASGDVLQ